jgi:hypothetical protein
LIRKRGYLFFTRDKLPEQTITNIYRKYLSCDKQNQFTVKSSKPGIYYFCIRNDKKKTMKILILCSDNSCLSQMAQGWLQSFDKSLTVCSAGISPAIEVHPLAVQTLASSGIGSSHLCTDRVTNLFFQGITNKEEKIAQTSDSSKKRTFIEIILLTFITFAHIVSNIVQFENGNTRQFYTTC